MKITIVCVGKLKEEYYRAFMADFAKRLSRFAEFRVVELPDLKIPKNPSDKDLVIVKEKEGRSILDAVSKKSDTFVVTLEILGKTMSSESFATFFRDKTVRGYNHFYFIIGGSVGLSAAVSAISDLKLSFSGMTFTHQFARMMITEQVYRACKINSGEAYHK